jgi:thymidylate synthase (FAD)
MKIIEPSFKLSTPYTVSRWPSDALTREDGIGMLRFIEIQARISHRSEDKQTLDSWERFIPAVVIQHGDWSVVEHVSLTATIRVDRGVTHELVRHRLFAFTQESTRFVRYKGELEFIKPIAITGDVLFAEWKGAMFGADQSYQMLLEQGSRPQEARSVLPNSLAATIAVTGNLRNWRHFFLMRTSKETHPDFKRITIPMLAEFKKIIPILYDDIEPDQRQVDNLRKPR